MEETIHNGRSSPDQVSGIPDLSIVVPLFNEEENVELLHREVKAALAESDLDYELVLIDDGSTDRTVEKLRRLAGGDSRLVVVRFRRNYGQTAAIQAGFDVARGRVVVTMDGDLQNDPADIPDLVSELGPDCDVVTGWRKNRQDRAISRRLPSMAANWLIGTVTGVRIHDNGCTLKAYRSEVVKKARLYAEMHRFLVPMLTLSGSRIKEVVVNHRARKFGTSKYGLSRVWKVFLDLLTVKMVLRFSSHPAAWFGLLAAPFVVAGIACLALSLVLYLTQAGAESFPIVVPSVVVLSIFVVFHLLLLGMFAELVVKTGDFVETEPLVYETRTKEVSRS